jgi:hypothetical protein
MHGKLLLVSLKEKYSDIVFVLIVGNDNNGTPSVREETRDDGGRALPLRLVAMTALVIPFRVDNIGASVGFSCGKQSRLVCDFEINDLPPHLAKLLNLTW